MGNGLFDSDLAYQDAVENFFAWKKQAIVGSEAINGVNCQILESKPDKLLRFHLRQSAQLD